MIRIAVLGTGRIGRMHAENIAAHPRATLAGVYDIHTPAAQEVAAKLGVPRFESAEAVLASAEVDAVLIATSTATHADLQPRRDQRAAHGGGAGGWHGRDQRLCAGGQRGVFRRHQHSGMGRSEGAGITSIPSWRKSYSEGRKA